MKSSFVLGCSLFALVALAGCANQQAPTATVSAAPAHPVPVQTLPPPPASGPGQGAGAPDIFNVLVDGKMYNHMDDARRALDDQSAKIIAQIPAAAKPRFGTLLVVAPPVHVPALSYPGSSPAYREKFMDFMTFLDSHKYEVNVGVLRKSNNFLIVTLDRSATPATDSGADFKIWQRQDGQATSWWIEGHGKGATKLTADLGNISIENSQALVTEVLSRAEQYTGR